MRRTRCAAGGTHRGGAADLGRTRGSRPAASAVRRGPRPFPAGRRPHRRPRSADGCPHRVPPQARRRPYARTDPADRGRRRRGQFVRDPGHHARRLHYDFRLERDGVMVSWAVPAGCRRRRRRTVWPFTPRTTPLEYASFAGSIPKGEYGGG
ncbi:hypothetical protein GS866_22005, partial [Rhodococcus hoagii]|nr:hypothetical protein [Prescottella equi]